MKTYYIYKMIHLPSGRVYIGQRKVPKGKTPENDSYFGSGKIWRQIYKKYKDECIKVIIDYADTKAEIDELEKKWIAYYRMTRGEFCVNISNGGEGNSGLVHTPETKAKMSAAHKGKKISQEQRENMSKLMTGENHPLYGKHHTEESRRKMSEKQKGRPGQWMGRHLSEEHRKKISEKTKGRIPWNKGKKCPRLSESQRGEKSHRHGKIPWNKGIKTGPMKLTPEQLSERARKIAEVERQKRIIDFTNAEI